jgi:hypothetical membrane protein
MNRQTIQTRSLATVALTGLTVFPVIVLALHVIQRHTYHPMSDAISDLALGRDGWLMAIAFCAAATGMLCLAIVLRRTVPNTVVVPALVAICSLLTYISAAFHADGGAKTTLHGEIHQTAGITTFVLLIVAMFVASRRFRRDPAWQRLARPTLLWGFATLAAFFLIPTLSDAYFGVAQRILIGAWLTWLITLAAYARQSVVAADHEVIASGAGRTAHA